MCVEGDKFDGVVDCDGSVSLGLVFFQAEDGIRDLVRSRGLGDVYKRQIECQGGRMAPHQHFRKIMQVGGLVDDRHVGVATVCLLYTSDAADERSSVDLGGRRIIKKKKKKNIR